jgi:hypothetical protein
VVERLPEGEYLSANPVSLALADNTQSPPGEQTLLAETDEGLGQVSGRPSGPPPLD